jgi:catechol 2,3-dioxygenase-like lactoylglutathione lyase family enzyme
MAERSMARELARARLAAVAIRALDPGALARFWAHALRWEVAPITGADVALVASDGSGWRLLFSPAADRKVGQNRIHFDLTTTSLDDQHATVAELLAIGATPVDIGQDPGDSHVVLADPEGNEFCVIEPTNRFLATCPRLGAVNCDGSQALGYFYSEALGWPLVWDQDEETAIQARGGTGPKITWSGPPLMPRVFPERLHVHLAPSSGSGAEPTLEHLVALGAVRAPAGHGCAGAIALRDVDGNDICLVAD